MTDPGAAVWSPPAGRRAVMASARIGAGDLVWARASDDLLHWRVKTRSGFRVRPPGRVEAGARLEVTALGGLVVEPVEVVAVIEEADRVGFAYRTRPGHPVDGEEAFVLSRAGDAVVLTVRSLTGPSAQQPWRALFPVLLVVQRLVRRRYLRSLRR